MDPPDILAEAILESLSDRIDPSVLKRALTGPVRKELYRRLAENLLYYLLTEGKLNLPPGFGAVHLKEIREKDKKIFNKATGEMYTKRVSGRRVAYRPGQTVKQLL